MQLRHWLFLVSVLLFVSGIGFIVAAERTRREVPAAEASPVEVRAAPPLATVKQIMAGLIMPAAEQYWGAVSITVSETGVDEKQPRSDEEWTSVATSAALLVESSTLLLQGTRAVDKGDWEKLSREMADASMQAVKAAESRDPEAVLAIGETIYKTCTSCHEKYLRN